MATTTSRSIRRSGPDASWGVLTDTWTLPGAVVCGIIGEVDIATAPQVVKALCRALKRVRPPGELRADLSGVEFFSAAGLNALLRTRKIAASRRIHMVLVAPSGAVRRILEVTDTTALFPVTTGHLHVVADISPDTPPPCGPDKPPGSPR
jgi:anti-anti-sigma factor